MKLTREQELLRQNVREFVKKEMADYPEHVDETGCIPNDIMEKLARYQFISPIIPKEYGGAGADYASYAIIMEEISKRCASTGTFITAGASLVALPLLNFGTEIQKQKYLKPLALGEKIGCFGLTEPGAGSDAASGTTTARWEGDHYVLNGRKCFITNAPIADFAIISAMTDRTKGVKGISVFIVDANTEGWSVGAHENKMGIRGTITSDIVLDNVKVPKENLLDVEGKGFKIMMNTLDYGRIGVAAQALGIAQGALDEAIKYVKERKQFGKPLSKFQNTQFKIAELATKVQAARLLVYDAAKIKDEGGKPGLQSSMAKYYAAEIANEVAYWALQLHGGYGYIKDYPIERMYRDARITSIYEGTSQIQQMVIAGYLLK
ncbi:acyl-CoA dehydrogenase [Fusobacterium necrophorum subsp. funduliforme]|uniref:putative isocaproyl-CoA dehydrogenase AcdB n=1 Tax=Fusobacterium necrophorum TaxID=859 RepID=UPI0007873032|nr:putative isocaproyl-CoA dehydrogenase AcdB [Fusobacterium necrophorum]KYL02487.1 acyl-CoA dehydrogenase [Fusobacterium necrophorum subsp. funduliforme]KYM38326.1 acyl-CoA dehydrogenase [Fusobacterium necrophorum subsp. funduliforme]KYM47568.1 acyl-CoA dehydrogenase [Fusobacterium necrophorum subsp. funduliforme]KYM61551.1 acyl-CoA dehydrogenase [Fusobacterium necrophorum subsp. funduliforme]MDK4469679.1 putative isocaproyl-CoA dehydrogenase AcdB [Fusobacterium necrophorum]